MEEDARKRLKRVIDGLPFDDKKKNAINNAIDNMDDETVEEYAKQFGDPEIAEVLPGVLAALRNRRKN